MARRRSIVRSSRGRFTAALLASLVLSLVVVASASATNFSFVRSWGGTSSAQFNGATWVARDSVNHYVYVTDEGHNRIKRFNFDGTPANFTAGTGSGSNNLGPHFVASGSCPDDPAGSPPSVCFSDPQGIAVDGSGNLYVADNDAGSVIEFDSTGAFVRQFGGFDTGGFNSGDNLGNLAGIAATGTGTAARVFVADNSNSRIVEFDPSSSGTNNGYVSEFGGNGSSVGQFEDLRGVAVDPSGDVYATDFSADRVTEFDSSGSVVTHWGNPDSGSGHQALGNLDSPTGIAFSPGDGGPTPASVFVVDTGNFRVQQFTPAGGNVAEIGSEGSANGQFEEPIGIAAVNQLVGGNTVTTLYVADHTSNLVQEFAPDQPPSNTAVPIVTGTPQVGQTLTTDNGTWTNNPTPPYAYDWQRCNNVGAPASCVSTGGTQQNYVLTSTDFGHTIRSCVTAHNNAGNSSAACSTTTAPVTKPPPPVNQTPPTIDGTAAQGRNLTKTDDGTWQGSPSSFTYQWQRCDSAGNSCADIASATNDVYTLTSDDVGHKVRLVVTAHNAADTGTPANSAPSDVVVGPPAAPTAPPSITGTAQSGQQLTAVRGTWPNDASNSYAYQWQRCDSAGANCANIDGAVDQTYTATDSDVGFTLRVVVTASNAAVPTTSATSDPTGVVAAVPAPAGGGGGTTTGGGGGTTTGGGGGTTTGGGGTSPVTTVGGSTIIVPPGTTNTTTVLGGGVPVSLTTVAGGHIKAILLIDGKTAKKAHLGNGKHPVVVGHGVATAGENGAVHLKLKLTSKAKKAIKKLKKYRLEIKITITDAAGHKFVITRHVTVRRKSGK